MKRILAIAEILIIVVIAIAPVFASFPYRINIFLSWEGAYRISEGHVPYRDFGIPVGFMYWVVPAAFFKIFGPYMITLIKAQAFMNLLAGFAFRSIFISMGISDRIRFLAVLLFSISFTFLNYWPWYNHTVIVYELIALAFLFGFLFKRAGHGYLQLILSGVFVFLSFFTKQDGGGLAFLLCLSLLLYNCFRDKNWFALLIFLASFTITALLFILPFLSSGFGYWFNMGQPPHSSRISVGDIIREFLAASFWLKFYLLIISLLTLRIIQTTRGIFLEKQFMLFLLLTAGIIAEAAIFQVTSYVPVDNNIFFHAFCFAFILYAFSKLNIMHFDNLKIVFIGTAGILLWWSHVYWKYVERFIIGDPRTNYTTTPYQEYEYADVVNRNTYIIELDTTDIPLHQWRVPSAPSFKKIMVPSPTADGIERLLVLPVLKEKPDVKVLNMSELTPLARDIPFQLEKGTHYPLWFHKGVGMFEKETNMFVQRIQNNYYDLVIFEYIPYLNNFYPFRVREALQQHYQRQDVFPAPRKPSSDAWVEVYVRKK